LSLTTTEATTMAQAVLIPKTLAAIRREFPGRNNTGLRKRLRTEALSGWIGSIGDVTLTASGVASLIAIQRVHRSEMQALGLADADGYPRYAIGPDEHGDPVAYLDQPVSNDPD